MGQKVNPIAFRLAVQKDWRSKWFATGKEFTDNLHSDLAIRRYLRKQLQFAALSKIIIERAWNTVRVTLSTARPGLVIGPKGSKIELMQAELSAMCGGRSVKLDIYEIKQPELDAQLVAENVALQLERRISFRRAMKRAVQTTMDFGAEGVRIRCAGRLGGADIARAEWYREGKVPLQTLRVPIDYGFCEARTVYGIIGVKCWINKKEEAEEEEGKENRGGRRGGDRRGGSGGDRRDSAPSGEATATEATPSADGPKVGVTGNVSGPVAKKAAVQADSADTKPADDAKSEAPAEDKAPDTSTANLGKVYDKAPDSVDDLKVISGVGPQLEEKLNGFGIYTFEQIAAWEPEQISAFDDLLSFKGRIDRDEWIRQAKEQVEENKK